VSELTISLNRPVVAEPAGDDQKPQLTLELKDAESLFSTVKHNFYYYDGHHNKREAFDIAAAHSGTTSGVELADANATQAMINDPNTSTLLAASLEHVYDAFSSSFNRGNASILTWDEFDEYMKNH